MKMKPNAKEDLNGVTPLLQNLIAIELWRGGLSQGEIGKRLRLAKATVNKMLHGVSRRVMTAPKNEE